MERTFIGIDPDVDGSGVAIIKVNRGIGFNARTSVDVDLQNIQFPELIRFFLSIKDNPNTKVVIEAGWKNHSNWHIPNRCGPRAAAEIGRRTGRNHQIAIDMTAVAESMGLNVIERVPFVKTWHGKDGKITHDEIVQVTGIVQRRTNQEQRDALLLAWVESGLPMVAPVVK